MLKSEKQNSNEMAQELRNKKKKWGAALLLCLGLWMSVSSVGLAQEAEVGMEYLKAGEYEKARVIFQKLAKSKESVKLIHKPYLQTLIKLKEWETAEKFLKKEIKSSDGEVKYIAEYGRLLEMLEKKEEAAKQFALAVDKAKLDDRALTELLTDLQQNGQYDLAIKAIEEARLASKQESKMPLEMAKLYLMTGKRAQMIEEYLRYGMVAENREMVQTLLQDQLKEETDVELFEKILYAAIQKYPEQFYYSEILSWHLIQKKEFNRAFVQLKALDRRYKKEGVDVNQLGDLAYQNKDFTAAGKIFEYLVKEYPKNMNYPLWRRLLITSKEELIKTTYPVSNSDIRILIQEYSKMLTELGMNQRTLEGLRSQALLYAFYLNQKDTAVMVLNKAIANAQGDQQFIDRCKLDLGDIYVLKAEPWEATLVYSQVEKSEKDSPLGYDAKLRNAKLAYYRGDFELAREVLDILKQATTREIANDAMDLSLLILENTGEDSTEAGMKAYAAIELLLFQHQDTQALMAMDAMLKNLKGNSLEDDVLFLRAKTYLRIGDVDKAIKDLETIHEKFAIEILGDDALYTLAKIYQDKLNQGSKAMKLFQELLTKYPGSIYGADARKRFRNLRGDAIN